MRGSPEDHGPGEVVVSGRRLRAVVRPATGAKVVSLRCLESGRELLWQDPRRPAPEVLPGARYEDGDRGGIDDCFPTVDPCRWPGPGPGPDVGDHGEVWTRPWTWTQDERRSAVFVCRTDDPPFRLRRRLTVTKSEELRFDYELTLVSGPARPFQWTGHPLLAVGPGTRVDLPVSVAARTGFALGGRVEAGAGPWPWPSAPAPDGGLVDVSRVPTRDVGINEKYWVAAPADGCRLVHGDGGVLHVRAEPAQLPWLAVCVDAGGWPADAPGHWVAVEPSTSPDDSLERSVAAGTASWIEPGETRRWWWSLDWRPHRHDGGETTW